MENIIMLQDLTNLTGWDYNQSYQLPENNHNLQILNISYGGDETLDSITVGHFENEVYIIDNYLSYRAVIWDEYSTVIGIRLDNNFLINHNDL